MRLNLSRNRRARARRQLHPPLPQGQPLWRDIRHADAVQQGVLSHRLAPTSFRGWLCRRCAGATSTHSCGTRSSFRGTVPSHKLPQWLAFGCALEAPALGVMCQSGRLPRSLSQPYSGSPAARSATPRAPASSGAQFTPENCRLNRNVGCNSKTCAAADLASSSRPSFASVAAKST